MQTMFSFGARSGVEQFRPYAEGDIITTKSGVRMVIASLEPEAYAEPALICIRLDTGADGCIVFPREVAWRST